jgi:hypothetical protein
MEGDLEWQSNASTWLALNGNTLQLQKVDSSTLEANKMKKSYKQRANADFYDLSKQLAYQK